MSFVRRYASTAGLPSWKTWNMLSLSKPPFAYDGTRLAPNEEKFLTESWEESKSYMRTLNETDRRAVTNYLQHKAEKRATIAKNPFYNQSLIDTYVGTFWVYGTTMQCLGGVLSIADAGVESTCIWLLAVAVNVGAGLHLSRAHGERRLNNLVFRNEYDGDLQLALHLGKEKSEPQSMSDEKSKPQSVQ